MMTKNADVNICANMKAFPPYLYHYTTIESLKCIIENQTLWLGDYRFMNDEEELIWCANCIENSFSRPEYQKEDGYDYTTSIYRIDRRIKDIIAGKLYYVGTWRDPESNNTYASNKVAGNTSRYIFCLSSNEDNKEMWKEYGKDELGCRIRFNTSELYNYFMQVKNFNMKTYNPYIFCTRVNYEESDLIDEVVKIRNGFKLGYEEPVTEEQVVFNALISHKAPAYSSENEYRIVCAYSDDCEFYESANREGPMIKKVYKNFGTYIKPFIEINKLPIESLISEIMISPYNKSDLATIGLKDWIYNKTKKEFDIVKSKIHIR